VVISSGFSGGPQADGDASWTNWIMDLAEAAGKCGLGPGILRPL